MKGEIMRKWFKKLFIDQPITREEIEEKIQEALGVKWIQSMQRLDVKDGDILVLRYPGVLSSKAAGHLRAAFQETIKGFGYDVRILILEEGMEMGTLRKEKTNK